MMIHSYVKLGKDFAKLREKLEESGKILGKTCGLGPTQRNTVEKIKGEIAPVELKGLNEVTSSKDLERKQSGKHESSRYLQHSGTIE